MKSYAIDNFTIVHDYQSLSLPLKKIKTTITQLTKHYSERIVEKEIVIILCSDYKVRKLNKHFRKKDSNTDVLSFPFNDPDFLGEIYISLQRATVQARRFELTYENEVSRLFVHGFHHLIGYDHITPNEREEMEELESKFC